MGYAKVYCGGVGMAIDVMTDISDCLINKKNFLLSGGAGSGKTYTLIQTLHSVYKNNSNSRVACITYTNVAADEIKTRSPYSKLWVSTIHDFLWDNIKGFQKNLIKTVHELVSNGTISYSGETPADQLVFSIVEYKNYRRIEDGTISHDDLLKVAEHMFEHYPLLPKILSDKYDFIFIDEYQDTQKAVVNIFLEHIKKKATGLPCLGFFGDKKQSIYDTGIVDIQSYVDNGQVKEIVKTDNYRCSQNVINLLNNIRSDLIQNPAKRNADGSIANRVGNVKFLYSDSEFDLNNFKDTRFADGWDFSDPQKTKLLFLTHRLIAKRNGWEGILSAYSNNDLLLGDEPDRIAKHLLKLGAILSAYRQGNYSLVIANITKKIRTNEDKRGIGTFLSKISADMTKTIETVIKEFNGKHLLVIDDRLNEYITNNQERYDKIKLLPISQILAYHAYYNSFSPYSTQHGIKGAEFDNVLVVMDNGRWNNYNFKYYFEGTVGKESVVGRTERIFYVCCSRTIENLVVFYPSPTPPIISKAKKMFGEANVIAI
jgi:DNA helicase-2/ATP-dependent DNA helicase PcrA